MNTKSKSKKGKEKGIIGITLAAIMIASIFAVIAPSITADVEPLAAFSLSKQTTPDAGASYYVGDTISYIMNATNPGPYACTVDVTDTLPNGTVVTLDNSSYFTSGQTKTYYTSYVVVSGDVSPANTPPYPHVINTVMATGWDEAPTPDYIGATMTKTSEILSNPPEFALTFVGIGCLEVEFNGSASTDDGSIVNHTWYYGDTTNSGVIPGAPGVINHTYATGGVKTVKLEGYDNDGYYNSTIEPIYVDKGPTAIARATPTCFEAGGTLIVFNGSDSHADLANTYYPQTIVNYSWTFSDNVTGSSDNAKETSRTVTGNDTIIATLTVTDSLGCEDIDTVTVRPCSEPSLCNLRIYGTYGEGAGDFIVKDPYTGLAPENKPYTDPVAPFFPQHPQAPRKDFITFNPAIMAHNNEPPYEGLDFVECGGGIVQSPAEKVFKRMWYEKEWFKDYVNNGEWDVVMVDDITTMTLSEWFAIDQWARPTIREWNSPDAPDWNSNADIYGPAIVQEFTYMTLDQDWYPIMVQDGSELLIPMAHDPLNPLYRGLNSFDADGDGDWDFVRVESEQTLGIDIDQDGFEEPMDGDFDELSGNETVVFVLGPKTVYRSGYGSTTSLQFFDHVVTVDTVDQVDGDYKVWLHVLDNEGDGSLRDSYASLKEDEIAYFYRAKAGRNGERPAFYVKLLSADYDGQYATIEVGRMFGQTYANIEANQYRSQKMFIVDEVFYNVVAIKAQDNCFKYITFRQKLPKTPIKIFGKHLKVWTTDEILPEMSPYNLDHEILPDINPIVPEDPPYPIVKIPPEAAKVQMPPLKIIYVDETEELRYKGELKEIYTEEHDSPIDEFWTLEWYWTLPWQYTEFQLPAGDKYLVTLSWYAHEAETTLWDDIPDEPVWYKTRDRFKFWYEDCSGPLYIDRANSSIRLYGTFGEGAGDQGATDVEPGASYDMEPENKPYTDPEGPFFPQHPQAPVKDFMTFNPAIMDHNQGYPELDFIECPGYIVQTPKEKVFKRMWYEKEWFKDYDGADTDGEWDVVIEQYDDLVDMKWEFYDVMTLSSWNAMPDYVKIQDMLRIREYNSPNIPDDWEPRADIYGPAIVQEFTYMTVNQDTMPIMVQAGSEILIPLAHNASDPYRGLNSFDADGDGVRDAVRVESERTLALNWGTQGPPPQPEDIDDDGTVEWMDADSTELNGNEQVVFVLGPKILDRTTELQFFDHVVELVSVDVAGGSYWVNFKVSDNEKGGYTRDEDCTPMQVGDVQHFYRGKYPAGGEKPAFYLKLLSADYNSQTVRIEVGRMFGQTHANIEFNEYRAQKMFIVDEVFYNVVAVKADKNCFKYITIRQKLPKTPIKIFGKDLKVWDEGETLPEMSPYNMDHEILVDVQPGWGAIPHSQQAKIGHKVPVVPLNITYVEEDKEWRFLGELKEIYNETDEPWPLKEEYWNVEWFHTLPMQYTAFVMPEGQGLYLMTLAWYAPEAEITIWNHDPDGPYDYWTYERVKFWYDPADNTDIYINRVGDIPEEEVTIADWYNMAGNGGDGIPWISSDEVINAVMDYLTADTDPTPEDNPFTPGSDPCFTKDDLLNYILAYLGQ